MGADVFVAQSLGTHKQVQQFRTTWAPPTHGFLKINVDAAPPLNMDFYRVRLVARDEQGNCLWWARSESLGRPHPSDAEAVAVLQGVKLARARSWRRIIVETYCYPIFRYLRDHRSSSFSYGSILDACFELSSFFQSLSFSFVRRAGNSLAHRIASLPSLYCGQGSSLPFDLI